MGYCFSPVWFVYLLLCDIIVACCLFFWSASQAGNMLFADMLWNFMEANVV